MIKNKIDSVGVACVFVRVDSCRAISIDDMQYRRYADGRITPCANLSCAHLATARPEYSGVSLSR